MRGETETLLEAGEAALRRSDWAAAGEAFERALAEEALPEAALGLSRALFWRGDLSGCLAKLEWATEVFLRRPDLYWAASGMIRLALHHHEHLEEAEAAAGWLARAERLVAEHSIESLRGELWFVESVLAEDPVRAEGLARQAHERGRTAADPDLELSALARLGASLVEQGHALEGLKLIDEALAVCLGGEPKTIDTVAFVTGLMIRSCLLCADHTRALQWIRSAERFTERHTSRFHHSECRALYGRVLVATGDVRRGEEVLEEAVELAREGVPAHRAQGLVALAELRLMEGRMEEAERILRGLASHPRLLPALARIRLLQGRAELAVAMLERRLHVIGRECLESSALLELLGEAELALGAFDAAHRHARALVELGRARSSALIAARADRLLGRALAERDPDGAARALTVSIDAWHRLELPYEEARARLYLGALLRAHRPADADRELRAALTALEGLGANPEADLAASHLRQLGVEVARGGPHLSSALTRREAEVLRLLAEGLSNPQIAGRLFLSRQTVEHHVANVFAKTGAKTQAEIASLRAEGESGTKPGA